MTLIYSKRSLCGCGYPVLNESVPLGKRYEAADQVPLPCVLICGGCQTKIQIQSIEVIANDGKPAGFLPLEIFEVEALAAREL